MKMNFYQIAGDDPGSSIFISPLHVVKVVPYGQNSKIYLSDKTSYEVAQTASVVKLRIQECLDQS